MTNTAKPTPGPYKLQISPTQPLSLWSDDANGVIVEARWRHGFPPQRDLPCEEAIANLHLTNEAFDAYHETGLTPRQLVERWKRWEQIAHTTAEGSGKILRKSQESVRELEAEQAELVQFFTQLANDAVTFGLDTEFGDGFSVGVKTVCDAIKSVLAKRGKGGSND
jgi:uncharacterized protein YktA (UPF0223 family)